MYVGEPFVTLVEPGAEGTSTICNLASSRACYVSNFTSAIKYSNRNRAFTIHQDTNC